MPRLTKLTALLLAAFWLPATLHCAMESAGVLPHWASCKTGAEGADHCSGDACATLETNLANQSSPTLKVSAPDVLACTCLVCLFTWPDVSAVQASVARSTDVDRPLAWIATWQFTRRAAPPTRAPSLLCA